MQILGVNGSEKSFCCSIAFEKALLQGSQIVRINNNRTKTHFRKLTDSL